MACVLNGAPATLIRASFLSRCQYAKTNIEAAIGGYASTKTMVQPWVDLLSLLPTATVAAVPPQLPLPPQSQPPGGAASVPPEGAAVTQAGGGGGGGEGGEGGGGGKGKEGEKAEAEVEEK